MTDPISFNLNFHKFNQSAAHSFSAGLHVIYGESGSGYTQLIKTMAGFESDARLNFYFESKSIPESIQIVFKNTEYQILSHTIET